MDYLSRCYTARVRPYRDSDATVTLRWYFCAPGAQIFPGTHLFGSQVFREIATEPPDGPGELFGPKKWDPGYNPGYVGHCHMGPDEWYTSGVPVAAVEGLAPVLPACCIVLDQGQLGGRGGWQGFNRVTPPPQWGALGGWTGFVHPYLVPTQWGGLGGWQGVRPVQWGGRGGWYGFRPTSWGGRGGWRGTVARGVSGRWGGRGGWRDNMGLILCCVEQEIAQSIPNATGTALTWDQVNYDPAHMFNIATPTRVTVPRDGLYLVTHFLQWAGMSIGQQVAAYLHVNGGGRTPLWAGDETSAADEERTAAVQLKLSAGDYLETFAYQASGAAKFASHGGGGPTLCVSWLGDVTSPDLPTPIFCRVHATANQALVSGATPGVVWGAADDDAFHMWDAAHPTRLTAPRGGLYLLTGGFLFQPSGHAGFGAAQLYKNGAFFDFLEQFSYVAAATDGPTWCYQARLNSGDYIEVIASQTSGFNWNILNAGGVRAWAQLSCLGPL